MSEKQIPLAILSHSTKFVVETLSADRRIERYSPAKARGVLKDGRPFVIYTSRESIMGADLLEYEIIGDVDSRLVSDADVRKISTNKKIAAAAPQDTPTE